MLVAESKEQLQEQCVKLQEHTLSKGLEVNIDKSKVMMIGGGNGRELLLPKLGNRNSV